MAWLRIQVHDEIHRHLKSRAALAGRTLAEHTGKVLVDDVVKHLSLIDRDAAKRLKEQVQEGAE